MSGQTLDGRQFFPYPDPGESRLYVGKGDSMADTSDRRIRILNGPRRLEKAMHMLEGIVRGVTIVHEFDFWDAVEDAGRSPDE